MSYCHIYVLNFNKSLDILITLCHTYVNKGDNNMISEDTKYIFRFPSRETRQRFKIAAATLNKSMNALLGEIIEQYLDGEIKRANV